MNGPPQAQVPPTLFVGPCVEVLAGFILRPPFKFILADPPYARAGGAHTTSSSAEGKHSSLAAADQFWEHWFAEQWRAIAGVSAPYACAAIFTDYRAVGALERAIAASGTGWNVSQCAVWDREAMGLGSPMRASHELIAFARGPEFQWAGRRDIKNVFRHRWPYGEHQHHPAEKPVSLLRELADLFGRPGPVLDPFAGSASSGVACRALDLAWVGVEQDPAVAAVAAQRLGIRARLLADTVVRENGGRLYLMNRRNKGWAEYAIPIANEGEAFALYGVAVGAWSEDEHGRFAPAVRVAEGAAGRAG